MGSGPTALGDLSQIKHRPLEHSVSYDAHQSGELLDEFSVREPGKTLAVCIEVHGQGF